MPQSTQDTNYDVFVEKLKLMREVAISPVKCEKVEALTDIIDEALKLTTDTYHA